MINVFNVFAEYAAAQFGPYEWDHFLQRGRLSRLHSSDAFQSVRNLDLELSTQQVPLSYTFIARHFADLGNTDSKRLEMLETAAPKLMEWALFEVSGPNRDDFCTFLEANWDLIPTDWQEGALQSEEGSRFSSKALKATKPHPGGAANPTTRNSPSSLGPSVTTANAPQLRSWATPPQSAATPLTEPKEQETSVSQPAEKNTKPVFIIHGHDDDRKTELYRVLHNITNIKPVILHQQASEGETIVEKLVRIAKGAGYAVALLTADDFGRSAKVSSTDEKPRGRQNVVFEAGYFTALLGRKKVALLKDKGVENIGDLDGVVYISLDSPDWRHSLATELVRAGYVIDWESLTH